MTACRDWQKTLFRASFKGVPFEVARDSVRGGRRILTHEYPSRDTWDNEDLGAAKKTVDVTGYTYGDQGDQWASRLFDVCNTPGPGTLVLPTYPSRQARCLTVERSFREDELGRFEIRMSFVLEAAGVGGLASFAFLFGAVVNTVATALQTVRSSFEASYNARVAPNVAREAATETVRAAATALSAASARLSLDPAKGPLVTHNIATLARDSRTISFAGEGADIVTATVFAASPLRRSNVLGVRIADALTGLVEATVDKAAVAEAIEPLTRFEAQPILNPVNCASVQAEVLLTSQIARYVRVMATIKWAEAKALARYARKHEAVQARADTVNKLNAEIDVAVDEDELDALLDVRNAVIEYLTKNGAELPITRKVQVQYPNPLIVIAHEVYGDPMRDEEIIARNGVEHPMYSPLNFEVAIP